MVGHGVGLEMENALDLNMPSNCEAWRWVGDDLGMHDGFWARSMVQN